jgi:PAS domain S-box-containing protein
VVNRGKGTSSSGKLRAGLSFIPSAKSQGDFYRIAIAFFSAIVLIAAFDLLATLEGWLAPGQLNLIFVVLCIFAAGTTVFAAHRWAELREEISKRQHLEEALRKSEEQYRTLAESAPEMIYIFSPDDKILYINQLAAEFLKQNPDQIVGRERAYLFPPEVVEDQTQILERVIATGKPVYAETMIAGEEWLGTWLVPLRYQENRIDAVMGISRVITERKRAQTELTKAQETLEQRVQERTEELLQANKALKEKTQSLRSLSRELVKTQEKERRRIARELHDDIGQSLTGLRLLIQRSGSPGLPLPEKLDQAQRQAGELLASVRAMSLELRPSMLDDLGLLPALGWQIERFSKSTGIQIHLQHAGLDCRFREDIETAAFRIVQEALTNVGRHANTQEAWVSVDASPGQLVISVEDKGVGFDPKRRMAGSFSTGLNGMEERAMALGGTLVVESEPGKGTRLAAVIPLESLEESA